MKTRLALVLALGALVAFSDVAANAASNAKPRLVKVWVNNNLVPMLDFRFAPRPPACPLGPDSTNARVRVELRWRTQLSVSEGAWCDEGGGVGVLWDDSGTPTASGGPAFRSSFSSGSTLALALDPLILAKGVRDYRYRVLINRQLARKGLLRVRFKYSAGGFAVDDPCIGNDNVTYSGGHLTCWLSASSVPTFKLLS